MRNYAMPEFLLETEGFVAALVSSHHQRLLLEREVFVFQWIQILACFVPFVF